MKDEKDVYPAYDQRLIGVMPERTRVIESTFPEPVRKTFWGGLWGILIRWILFLPIAFLGVALLHLVATSAAAYAVHWEAKMNLTSFFVYGITIPIGFMLTMFLLTIPYMIFKVAIGAVAPTPRVATVIFGTLYIPLRLLVLVTRIAEEPWWFTGANLLVDAFVVFGIIKTYLYNGFDQQFQTKR